MRPTPKDQQAEHIKAELIAAGGAMRRVDLHLDRTGRRRLAALVAAGAIREDQGLLWLPGTDATVLTARRHRAMLTCALGARAHGIDIPSWIHPPAHWVTGHTGLTQTSRARPFIRHVDRRLTPPGPRGPIIEPLVPLLARLACCADTDLLAVAALDCALRSGKVRREQIEREITGRTHAPRGRRRLALGSERARSPIETAARLEMLEAGLPLRDGVVLPGVGEVDFLVAEQIVVETDGRAFHEDPLQFQRDRTRDRTAAALGLVTLRFTFDDVVRGRVATDVRAALAGRCRP